jgi:hypothetical protein
VRGQNENSAALAVDCQVLISLASARPNLSARSALEVPDAHAAGAYGEELAV